jgi:uncharacterized membrane protein YfcA
MNQLAPVTIKDSPITFQSLRPHKGCGGYALVGAIFELYQNVVNIPVAITLGIGALIVTIIGAEIMALFKPYALKALFGFLFLYVSLKYFALLQRPYLKQMRFVRFSTA